MVSSIEKDPSAHHRSAPHKHIPLFQQGHAVEVSYDEEGFFGAWFPATIVVECSAPKSITTKKRKKVVVRYDTLLKDDGRTPLTESVDPAFIRPVPPGQEKRRAGGVKFEVNDVVEAKDRDGWWSGVVGKILEGGKRYRVLFDNPPDFLDCGENDLRFRYDWVFCKWVRAKKLTRKPSKGEEIFGAGADVEVNFEKETVGDTWLPAVVIKRGADQTFFVKCQGLDSLDDEVEVEATKEDVVVVDSQHIRPSPPSHSRTDYELLDHVDGLIAGSWQKGLVTKVTKGKYTVYIHQQKEDKEFSLSQLRPHLDWIHGEWRNKSKVQSKGLVVANSNTKKLNFGDISGENVQLVVVPVSTGASCDNISDKMPCSSTTRIKMDDSSIYAEKSASGGFTSSNKKMKVISDLSGKKLSHRDTLMEGDAGEAPLSVKRQKERSTQKATSKLQKERLTTNAKSSQDCNQLSAKSKKRQANLVDLDCQKVAMVASIGRRPKSPVGTSLVSVSDKEGSPENCSITLGKSGEDVLKEGAGPLILGLGAVRMSHSSNSSPARAGDRLNPLGDKKRGSESSVEQSLERKQQKTAVSDRRKRESSLKYSDINTKMDAGSMSLETIDNDSDCKKIVVNAVTDEFGGQLELDLESTAPQIEELEKSVNSVNEVETAVVGVPEGVAEADQPLSLWCGGFSTPISTCEDGLSSPSVNGSHARKKRQVDAATNSAPISTNSNALLFEKRSPLWAPLDSMEIFKILPQRPHFTPLKACEEKYREGAAIGVMVTFTNLLDDISKLTIYDSKSSFEGCLKSLSDFENHGFDISVPRGRINKLLSMKNQHMEWSTEDENAERDVDEHVEEDRKLEAKVKELEEKMLALQQTLAAAKGEMEGKKAKTAVAQAQADKMKGRVAYAKSEFERVSKSAWKLP